MITNFQNQNPENKASVKKVEDIFERFENKKPAAEDLSPRSAPAPMPVSDQQPKKAKKIWIIIIIVIILLVVGALVYPSYHAIKNFYSRLQDGASLEESNKINSNIIPNQENNQLTDESINKPKTNEPAMATANIDSDQDGLSDKEEMQYRTNSKKADTDADGLFDKEEIFTFHTDPLDSDSDNDGYLDGEEIRGGYDPNGPGKLLNFKEELRKIQ